MNKTQINDNIANKGIQKWYTPLVSWLSSKKDESEPDEYDQEFRHLGLQNLRKEGLQNKQEFLKKIMEDGSRLRTMGEEDGRNAMNVNAMKSMVQNMAERWQFYILSSFKHGKETAELKVIDAKEHCKNLEEQEKFLLNHKKVLDTHYKFYSKRYNRALGWFYLIAALFLVIADFPLAMQSARDGFAIEGSFTFSPEDFTHATLFAVGLVAMTIYFKILYDTYFGTSISRILLRSQPKNILGGEDEAEPHEQKKAKRIKILRAIVHLLVFTVMTTTIIFLGVFRYDYVKTIKTTDNNVKVGVFEMPPTDADAVEVPINEDEETQQSSYMEGWWVKTAFVLVSLLFPLVGGICASLGLSYIGNYRGLRKYEKMLAKNHEEKKKGLEQHSLAENLFNEIKGNMEWAKEGGAFHKNCSEYFYQCYQHGYDRGIHQSIPDDFFSAVQWTRSKIIASKVSAMFAEREDDNTHVKQIASFFFGDLSNNPSNQQS